VDCRLFGSYLETEFEVVIEQTVAALGRLTCSPDKWSPGSTARKIYFFIGLPSVGKWDGDIYRESSHIQLTSHVFPPSDEKDCSIRDDLGEMLSQT
jgi:hypothetical protein